MIIPLKSYIIFLNFVQNLVNIEGHYEITTQRSRWKTGRWRRKYFQTRTPVSCRILEDKETKIKEPSNKSVFFSQYKIK
jgi:hypothetical protein